MLDPRIARILASPLCLLRHGPAGAPGCRCHLLDPRFGRPDDRFVTLPACQGSSGQGMRAGVAASQHGQREPPRRMPLFPASASSTNIFTQRPTSLHSFAVKARRSPGNSDPSRGLNGGNTAGATWRAQILAGGADLVVTSCCLSVFGRRPIDRGKKEERIGDTPRQARTTSTIDADDTAT